MSEDAAERVPKRLHWRTPDFNKDCVDKGTTASLMVLLEQVSAGAGFHRRLREKPLARAEPRVGDYIKGFVLNLRPRT
jgi:hypothetical protein